MLKQVVKGVPWVIKYRPKKVDDVVDQDNAKRVLIPWFKAWAAGRKPEKKAALLYGPPGIGKTSLVEAIANEYGFELLELNASDYRRDVDIKKTVGVAAKKRPLFKKGTIILLDEIDGIAPREDAGGLKALLEIIPQTENPIVMTANDPWKDQLKPLREVSLMVEFKPLPVTSIVALLQRICDAERLKCDREALRFIAEKSMGDVRAAINDLQAVAEGYGEVTLSLVRMLVRGREKTIDIWKTLNAIFYSKYAWQSKKAVTSSEEDYESLIAWINDNVALKYVDPEDLYRAYEALSRATLMLARAKYGGEWSLLAYVFDLMGPGVTMARKGEISKSRYSYPERIKLLAQLREVRELRERIAETLARRILCSKATVKNEVLPILNVIFRYSSSPLTPARIALGYMLGEKEIKLLAGPRANEILKAVERLKKMLREEVSKAVEEKKAVAIERAEEVSKVSGKRRRKTERRAAGKGLERFFT